MATYHKTITIAAPLAVTFAYVSDFGHTGSWDPRVIRARRTDGGGPIGVGARFVLVSKAPIGTSDLPYTLVAYEPSRRVVYEGQVWYARYRDELTFTAAGAGATSLTYDARFDLRGLLRLGSPIMSLLFRRIGDDAVRGIPGAVERAARATAATPP